MFLFMTFKIELIFSRLCDSRGKGLFLFFVFSIFSMEYSGVEECVVLILHVGWEWGCLENQLMKSLYIFFFLVLTIEK